MPIQHDTPEEKEDETPQKTLTIVPDSEAPPEQDFVELESREAYPNGISFVFSTTGLMAVVLVLALGNYIISKFGQEQRHYRQEAANISGNRHPYSTTHFNNLNLIGWYGNSYFLTLMAFQPAFGQLCTLFPVKTVYLLSIAMFEAGSVVSATAPNSEAFIIGRVISGTAGGDFGVALSHSWHTRYL